MAILTLQAPKRHVYNSSPQDKVTGDLYARSALNVRVFLTVCWCDFSYNHSARGSNSAETFFRGARRKQLKVIFCCKWPNSS